jgi:protein O-mannosyl-transferase
MTPKEQDITFKNLFLPLTNLKVFTIIIIIGLSVLFNGLFNGFVGDDPPLTTENPTVQSLKNLPIFFTSSTFYSGAGQKLSGYFYRPLQTTVFSIIFSSFGSFSSAFHLFQVIVFILNCFLLYLLFKQFFRKEIAFLLSLVFLVHPINSEAAFYISVTQEPLFLFFGLLALLILKINQSKQSYIITAICLLFSLLSKEAGILFFGISIIYFLLFIRKNTIFFLASLFTSFGLYLILRINAIGIFAQVTQNAPIQKLNLLERLINLPSIFFFYLKTFMFPLDLAVIYQWINTKIDLISFVFPLIIDLIFLCLIILLGVYFYRNSLKTYFYSYIFFAIWLFLGMSLYLQIIPLDMTVSEQWFYFPSIGALGIIGILIEVLKNNFKHKIVLIILTIIILILLSIRTSIRGLDYKDSFTLATHDLKISKEAYGLEHELSNIYFVRGDLNKAKIHAEKSIALYPYIFNYTDLGNANFYLGNYEEAKTAYLNALKYGDNYVTYDNLAALAINYGNPKENIIFIKNALRKYPGDARLWLYLAVLEYQSGNINDAKIEITNAQLYNQGLPEINQIYSAILNNMPLKFKVGK